MSGCVGRKVCAHVHVCVCVRVYMHAYVCVFERVCVNSSCMHEWQCGKEDVYACMCVACV